MGGVQHSSGLRELIACAVETTGPFACGRHANCVFANTHHSARHAPVHRRGSHTPPRRPGGLLLFQRPSRAAGEPNQIPALRGWTGIRDRDSGTGRLAFSLCSKTSEEKEACGKHCLRTLTSSQMCVSHSSVRVCVCVCAFSFSDAQTCISKNTQIRV